MSDHSLSDQKVIEQLERSRDQLLSGDSASDLVRVLRRKLQSITRNVYVLRWVPEQAEDIYDVLVDGVTVVRVEISRVTPGQETAFESWTVEEYRSNRKALTKPERRKLELALELARSLRNRHEG